MPYKKPDKYVLKTSITLDPNDHADLIALLEKADTKAYAVRELMLLGLRHLKNCEGIDND